MRCPDCSKFVAFGEAEIEVNLEGEYDKEAHVVDVTGEVVVNRPCEECGQTLKSMTFDVNETLDLASHFPEVGVKEVEVEFDEEEETQTGGGRYAKNLVGFSLKATVTTNNGHEASFTIEDSAPASHYEEQV